MYTSFWHTFIVCREIILLLSPCPYNTFLRVFTLVVFCPSFPFEISFSFLLEWSNAQEIFFFFFFNVTDFPCLAYFVWFSKIVLLIYLDFYCCYLIPFWSVLPLSFHIKRNCNGSILRLLKGHTLQLFHFSLWAPRLHLALERIKFSNFHLLFSESIGCIGIFLFSSPSDSIPMLPPSFHSTDDGTMHSLCLLTACQHLLLFWGCRDNFSRSLLYMLSKIFWLFYFFFF